MRVPVLQGPTEIAPEKISLLLSNNLAGWSKYKHPGQSMNPERQYGVAEKEDKDLGVTEPSFESRFCYMIPM